MSIKVRYFASLKELVGHSETQATYVDQITPRCLWAQLNPQLVLPDNLLVAINMQYVALDAELHDGDELAFFPPVTGG